jgi:hypothetical protein
MSLEFGQSQSRASQICSDSIRTAFRNSVPMSALDSQFQEMNPTASTAPELRVILAELSRREPIFHRPEFGTTRTDFDGLMAEDYWETGASGRRNSRQVILDELETRFSVPHADVWETSDFQCRKLSDDTYLLTYTLLQDNVRLTRRATIWRKTAGGWKIVYHQGTIVQDVKEVPVSGAGGQNAR